MTVGVSVAGYGCLTLGFVLQAMFAAQLVGMFGGCFLAPATFQMFVAGQPDLGQPGSTYPAPFAQVYRNMAVVGVGGASELGDNCLYVRAAICAAPKICDAGSRNIQ